MILRPLVIVICAFFIVFAKGDASSDAETCKELCKSCNGVASFVNNQCECNVGDNTSEGAECVIRMRREAEDRGLNLSSCDLSSDQRTTRCTLGLKHKLMSKNGIDQVVNYFMKDGPITGSIFKAPPYTKAVNCLAAPKIITQPPETMRSASSDYRGQPQQFVSSPRSDCVVAVQQPAPQQTVSSSHHQLSSSPHQQSTASQHHHLISSPHQQVVSNPPTQEYVSSSPSQAMANSSPQQYVSSTNSDCVGSSQIITQPADTMPVQESKAPSLQPTLTLGKSSHATNAPKVGAINPLNALKVTDITPTLIQILSQHLSQPMLGIPQAIQTVSKTPGISDLISAPGHLLHALMARLSINPHLSRTSVTPHDSSNSNGIVGDSVSWSTADNYDNPSVGAVQMTDASNPSITIPTSTYTDHTLGSPLTISLMNPMIGAPMSNPMMGTSAHISYVHPIAPYSMIHGPMMGSFVPHVPTYIVGSPFGMPYLPNYNSNTSPVIAYNPSLNTDSSHSSSDPTVGQSNIYDVKATEVPVLKPKKICKKSSKEEIPKKIARDIKAYSELTSEQVNHKEQIEVNIEAEKQIEYTTTEIPKIERTTTQKPIIGKQTDQRVQIDKSTAEKGRIEKRTQNVSKIKINKDIIKKPKGEQKNVEEKSNTKN